ncbi:hypothetical protein Cantr_05015 [Candida viswanathii]|uniref:Uncharacterized protein n=1 Tax=Candida viswanathii TaxID=5486 RepID=A0A367XRK1_9ASCO|nr:hypothetical protein Cantr_05015 [Candida viswanathii]
MRDGFRGDVELMKKMEQNDTERVRNAEKLDCQEGKDVLDEHVVHAQIIADAYDGQIIESLEMYLEWSRIQNVELLPIFNNLPLFHPNDGEVIND